MQIHASRVNELHKESGVEFAKNFGKLALHSPVRKIPDIAAER
jgi:hypothetical protein